MKKDKAKPMKKADGAKKYSPKQGKKIDVAARGKPAKKGKM